MKKSTNYILLLIFFVLSAPAFAEKVGPVNAIWSYPAAFKPDQQVTFYFDVQGTTLVGRTDLHLYSWTPKEIEPWSNPTANTLLIPTSNTAVYTLTCIPNTLWGSPADFGFIINGLIKTEAGDFQTDDFSDANGNAFKLFDYAALSSNIAVVWPAEFSRERPISIIANMAAAWSNNGTGQGELVGEQAYIWLGMNAWTPGSQYNALGNPGARCSDVPNETNITQYNFWPDSVFPTPPVIKELDFLFNNGTWDKTARDVGGKDFIFKPATAGAGSASFTIFPKKVTQLDIMSLIYTPSLDTTGAGIPVGILTGSDRIYVFMEFETGSGALIPVDKAVVPQTQKLQMTTLPDGTYQFSFILNELFTETELPAGVEVKKIKFTFMNFDGASSPFGDMPAYTVVPVKSDN